MYKNSTRFSVLMLCSLMSLSAMAKDVQTVKGQGLQKPLSFIENKGQVRDMNNIPRGDIQYKLSTPGVNLYVGNGQLHYQFEKIEHGNDKPMIKQYLMDVSLLGANTHATAISMDEQQYYESYFLGNSGHDAMIAHSFNRILYKNVYPGIDWMLYVKNGSVEYDFIVHPGGKVSDIKLKYDGATELSRSKDGGVLAETPMGNITEKKPYSFENETGKAVASNFKVKGNILSFDVEKYNGTLTIDPSLAWSTYFGGALEDVATSVKETTSGVTFIGGYTSSSGLGLSSFHTIYGAATYEGFLTKYDAFGARLFTAYIGSSAITKCNSIALDNTGGGNPNIFVAGVSNAGSLGVPPVAGYHGLEDGFVAKISNNGSTLIWCTYFGGTRNDHINGIVCDGANNVYVTGQTASTGISVGGPLVSSALRGINDAFVAKIIGASGVVNWCTYYGGTAQEEGFAIACDNNTPANIFITGQTNSIINIATTGAYQPLLSGTNDAFVAKISSTGSTLLWGTYFGGPDIPGFPGTEQGNGIVYDATTDGAVVVGSTTSRSGIASAKAHQGVYGGGVQDAFVTFFNASGMPSWSTYFGGSSLDYGQGVCLDNNNNIVIAGGTFSSDNISSQGALQAVIAGDYDSYVAKFNRNGQRLWGTYFGGLYYDFANAVACDNNNQLTIAGYTTSAPSSGLYGSNGLATIGASQTFFAGGTYDAFVTKFTLDTFLEIDQPFIDTIVCPGGTLNVSFTTNIDFQLSNVFTVELSDLTGSFIAPVTIGTLPSNTSGTITCTIPSGTPVGSNYRIRIVASNPSYASPDNFFPIRVVSALSAPSIVTTNPTCVNTSMMLDVSASYAMSGFSWTGPAGSGFGGAGFTSSVKSPVNNGFFGSGISKADSGIYTVIVSHNGCPDVTASLNVVVNDVMPPAPVLSSNNPVCDGGSLMLYAVPGISTPGIKYSWSGPAGFSSTMQNPVITGVSSGNAGTYFLADNLGGCSSGYQSIDIVVTPTTPASVSILASPGYTIGAPGDTICAGTNVTFTAIPVNGGVSAKYQWMSGVGTPIIGAMSDVFSSSTLTDGSAVFCIMNSSVICPSPVNATSNIITMNVITNPPVVKIFASNSYVKPGGSVTFTSAVFNGGISPLYQWKKNGKNIAGATDDSYILTNVQKADTISLELTSTMMCATPNYGISNDIVVQTNVGVVNKAASVAHVDLFPNPNTGSFTLKGEYTAAVNTSLSIEIFNAVGQVVYTGIADVRNGLLDKSVDMHNVASGVYLLRLQGEGQTNTLRFTVSR